MAELKSYNPTQRDQLGRTLADVFGALGLNNYEANRLAAGLTGSSGAGTEQMGLADLVPGVGTGLAADEATHQFQRGDMLGGGLSTLAAALGTLAPARGSLPPTGVSITPTDKGFKVTAGDKGFIDVGDHGGFRHIRESKVAPEYRGQGVGVDLYKGAANESLRRGGPLASDLTVSEDAARIYDALARRGYMIGRGPSQLNTNFSGFTSIDATGAESPFTVLAGPDNRRALIPFGLAPAAQGGR